MYQKKLETSYRCPLDKTFEIFGGKWSTSVYCLIYQEGSIRYTDFRKKIDKISDPVLASTLKHFRNQGIVKRNVYDEMPMRVEYLLTDKGLALAPIFKELCKWSSLYHVDDLKAVLKMCKDCDCYNIMYP